MPSGVIAARAAVRHGQRVVMGAPNIVCGGSQSGNVAATELLSAGLLHILSSDYVPSSPLQAVFQLSADGTLDLTAGAKLISGNPARAVGLDDRGEGDHLPDPGVVSSPEFLTRWVGVDAIHHRGVEEGGMNTADADIVGAHFEADAVTHRPDPGLAGRVGRL